MDIAQGSYEAAAEMGLPPSFTEDHGCLLDLCLKEIGVPSGSAKTPEARSLEGQGIIITRKDLSSLAEMVEVEFLASLRKELIGSETTAQACPHAFDVFLMQAPMNKAHGKGRSIAVCVPLWSRLVWWNGLSRKEGGRLVPLKRASHVRKIASLSGSARILQGLDRAHSMCLDSQSLVVAAMNRERMLKVDHFPDPTSPRTDSNLNEAQEKAVRALSSFDSGFFCIQGPPGCGKTTTMVQMIMTAKERSSVIVVAPSNAAVANVALKLYETGLVPFSRMVIFGENCHESVRFLQPKFRSEKYTRFRKDYENALRVTEGKVTSKQVSEAKKLLRDIVAWLHLHENDDDDLTLADLAKQCPILPLDKNGSLSRTARRIFRVLLSKADVVFCTLNSAGSSALQSALIKAQFHTLMLDEGGQCTEAEFFIAASFPGLQRIVVMGDPKQLRPTVISPECVANGLEDSFLGLVNKKDPRSLHFLDTQYRMDPDILRFPNHQFYADRIKCGDNVYRREPFVENPFLFEDTAGKGQEAKVGFSWQNQYEVSVINIMLRSDSDILRLLSAGLGGETKVIIITPYKSQMTLLQDQIKLPEGSRARVVINTVDAFQGQEGDVVIVSTVRTKKSSFVDDAQRLNVALTRARRVIRVVGDSGFFQKLGRNSTLHALALHASKPCLVKKSRTSHLYHCPPDWAMPTAWDITLTEQFIHCVMGLKKDTDKIYSLHTLFALATPDLESVLDGEVSETTEWNMNSVDDVTGRQLCVVWIAKTSDTKPIIEAHFAGRREAALQFLENNSRSVPPGAAPKLDMKGLHHEDYPAERIASFVPSWRLDNSIQEAILRRCE